jgi:hypothetical protein
MVIGRAAEHYRTFRPGPIKRGAGGLGPIKNGNRGNLWTPLPLFKNDNRGTLWTPLPLRICNRGD